ncbi:MAG: glycosyltransferase [Phycisphaerales bacterium]|nr:glycosyltransferase [Phycisphaerales bacterium]
MHPDISVIVPSRGRIAQLGTLLDCLARQELPGGVTFEVVVGLDGHSQADADQLPARFPFPVTYLPLAPVGISAAKNAAVAAARGDVLLFVNDDIEPEPGFIAAHAAAQAAGHAVVLGASPFVRWNDQTVFDEVVARTRMIFFYGELQNRAEYGFRYAWNLNLAVRRERLSKLSGPFSDGLRPVFYDDVEFAHRVVGDETAVYYCADAYAPHRHRYTFRDYFEREALLGVMSTALAEVNPACHRAIFGASPADLLAAARTGLAVDVPDQRRALATFSQATSEYWHWALPPEYSDTLYALHLPLKRRAFRSGLVSAANNPKHPWTQRIAMAHDALRNDPVFTTHAHWSAQSTRSTVGAA